MATLCTLSTFILLVVIPKQTDDERKKNRDVFDTVIYLIKNNTSQITNEKYRQPVHMVQYEKHVSP